MERGWKDRGDRKERKMLDEYREGKGGVGGGRAGERERLNV